ncbi:MAG: LLM class flavin-dependent oxidoreductase [Actinomycetota bacterium]|nr:LLM class flavin-dependent oxidoreductase [Actinomycetota bacterium]
MDEALEMMHRLFDGERISGEGHFRFNEAYPHTRPYRRPPIYVSAFGPRAAAVAGRWGDGLWTLADPENAPDVIEAYRAAADDAAREAGEVLQSAFSWAANDEAAFQGALPWKGAQPDEFYTDDWHRPREMYEHGAEHTSDEELKDALIISADPEIHVERIREIEELGATTVVLANNSGADPHGAIAAYGEHVLPALRGARVG